MIPAPWQLTATQRAELTATLALIAGQLDPVRMHAHRTGMDGWAAAADLALMWRARFAPVQAAINQMGAQLRDAFASVAPAIRAAHDADPGEFHQLSGGGAAIRCGFCEPQADAPAQLPDEAHADAPGGCAAAAWGGAEAGEADAAVGDPAR